jgi:hypothetical protein
MSTRSYIIKTALLLLVLTACAALAPQREAAVPCDYERLRFGQSLALSDFDGDNVVDRARLSGAGLLKSIEIYLSHTNKLSFIQFNTNTTTTGSLFAEDVDDDGDTDLIWTDLLHPDDVIIWLSNGAGRFERICPHEYEHQFVIGNNTIAALDDQTRDDLAGTDQSSRPDLALNQGYCCYIQTSSISDQRSCRPIPSGAKGRPCERGPPSLS